MLTVLLCVMAAMTFMALLVSDNTKLFWVLLVITAASAIGVLLLNDNIYKDVSGFLHGLTSELSPERMEQLVTALGAYMVTLGPLVQGLYELSRDMMQQELTVGE